MINEQGVGERGPGRPSIGKSITVWLPDDVRAQVDALTAELGVKRSAWIRDLVMAAAGCTPPPQEFIELIMPYGPNRRQRVGLNTLTPKARALAEAIAETPYRTIRSKSVAPERDLIHPDYHAAYQPSDQPITRQWDSWWQYPRRNPPSAAEVLEWEARKLVGWYPVAQDGSDLPSSQAARADDGLTPDQCLTLLVQLCPGHPSVTDKDTWMRKATKGRDGYPAPVRHNGQVSLWSEADVRAFASRAVDALAREA